MSGALRQPSDPLRAAALALVPVAQALNARGWTLATSGNFSMRLGDGGFAISRSGVDKGRLTADDFLAVDADGNANTKRASKAAGKPSAETLLHALVYRLFADAAAVVHIHAPAATALSRLRAAAGEVRLADYEMLKALAGIETHATAVVVPIVDNDQDMKVLAEKLTPRLATGNAAHGFLIAGHGLYAWGRDAGAAQRHAEALELMFDCELRLAR